MWLDYARNNRKLFALGVLALLFSGSILAQPAISSISPSSAIYGSTVTINGNNFSSTAANDIVFFNGAQATVTSASTTQLKVTVPTSAVYGPISVTVSNQTAYSTSMFVPTFNCGVPIAASGYASVGSISVGNTPEGGSIADLDGDGMLDLIIVDNSDSNLQILRNTSVKGTISFAAIKKVKTGYNLFQCTTGDLDGDGKLDIVAASFSGDSIYVLRNTSTSGSLSFAAPVALRSNNSNCAVRIADMNADGKPDIVVAERSRYFHIYENGISGSSITASSFTRNDYLVGSTAQMNDIQVGDMNGDGKPDVVIPELSVATLHTFINGGSLSFTDNTYSLPYNNVWGITLADLNKDGMLDVAGTFRFNAKFFAIPNTTSGGTFSLGTETDVTATGMNGLFISAADLDGDGDIDLVAANLATGNPFILPNTYSSGSSISFGTPFKLASVSTAILTLVGDLDGDGRPDIYLPDNSSKIYGFHNISGFQATVTVTGALKFCSGDSTNLKAKTGTGYSYQWYRNDTAITGSTDSMLYVKTTGRYKVAVKNSGGCSDTSITDTVTVYALPSATITPSGATTFCTGGSVTLNVPTGTGLTYQWAKDGSDLSGETNSSYTATASGSYTVKVKNSNGCTTTSAGKTVTVNSSISASIAAGGPTTFCTGGNVDLNATTGTGYTYQWSKDGNTISGATSATYTATASGSYTVFISNGSGCSGTSSATVVTVNSLPSAVITPATSTTFCQGGSVQLNANTGSGLSYQWVKDGSNISGATSSSYTTNAAGSYTVVVTNGSGCSATSSASSVTVNSLPSASITTATATTFCAGDSVVMNANTGTGLTYQWKKDGATISGATSSTYAAKIGGNYTVVVTNSSGCSTTSSATSVTVNALPSATITPASATTFCQGGSVVLNANTGVGLSYVWTKDGSVISGATSSSYTASSTGSYIVTVTNGSGCSATSSATLVTVNSLPDATISASGATTICAGNSVTLSVANVATSTYQWKKDGVNISGANSASYIATVTANYTVTVTSSSGCTVTSAATSVTVNPLPSASIFAASSTTFCQGGSVVFYANTGTGLSYQWYKDGSPISGATNSSYTATVAGSYMVAVTNSNNCTASSSAVSVTVNSLPSVTISASGSTTFCSGSSVNLNAPTGTGFSYIWMLNGSAISGATSATYTAGAAGDYSVMVTDGNGCSATSSATTVTVNALPNTSVNVIGSATRCQNDSVQMTANKVSGNTYQWRKDGINISGATSSEYTAKTSGVYKVVITNGSGCTDSSAGTTITINPLPTAIITSLSGSTTFCSGGSVTMGGLTGTGYKYQWLMNGSSISGATSSSYTANQTGSYSLMVTNTSGCSAVSLPVSVTVNPLPNTTVTPYGTTTRCQGDSVILNANSVSGYKYQWKLNGVAITGANSSSYAAKSSGTYRVVISNAFGCTDSSSATVITINPLPSVKILASTTTSICAGGSSYLSLSSTVAGTTYQWQLDGKDVAGATSSIYLASKAGSYTVKATNSNGCSNISNAISVIVNALPAPAVSALGTTTFCEGDSVTLITGASAGNKYQWQMDGADITGATDANITVHQSGNYRVVVTNASGCTDSSKHITVTVNPLPNPQVFAFGPAAFCEGGSVLIKAKMSAAGTSYQWFKDGVAMSGDSTVSITANKSGTYQLLQTIKTTGCSVWSNTIAVTVYPAPASLIQPLGKTTFCAGGSVILYAGAATGKHYYWFRSGGYINVGNVNTITATDSGSYTLVTQDSATGCSSTSKAVTVTLIALPQAVIMQPATTTYCEGASTFLHVDKSLLTAGKNSYQWYLDGVIIPRATNDSLLVTTTGDYTVEVTSEFGCVNRSIAQGMTFYAAPVVKYTFPRTACATVPVNFLNRSYVPGNNLTYMWTFGDGDSSDVESPSHAYKAAGKYKIVLVATSGTGCTTMFMDSIVVRKVSSPDFTVSHIGPRLFTYTAKDTTGTDYKWYFGDGMTATGKTVDHDYFVDGTYLVTLQVANASGCVTSFSDSVTVNSTGLKAESTPGNSMSIYPNPFITNSNITYTLGQQSNVTLDVYDMLGKKVETLFNGQQESGKYVFTFDSRKQDIPSDVYIVKLRVDQNVYIQRLVRVQ